VVQGLIAPVQNLIAGNNSSLELMHDAMDYTPYEGIRVRGWPVTTLSRGEVVAHEFQPRGTPGRGRFLPCEQSPLARPRAG